MWCATYKTAVVIHWDQRKFKQTLPLHKGTENVGILCTMTQYSNFAKFLYSHTRLSMVALKASIECNKHQELDISVNLDALHEEWQSREGPLLFNVDVKANNEQSY